MSTTTVQPQATSGKRYEYVVMPTLSGIGYGNYNAQPKNFVISMVAHVLAAVIIFTAGLWIKDNAPTIKKVVYEPISGIILPPSPDQSGGGGGGGDLSKLEASKGLPPKLDMEQITPPVVVVKNEKPKLVVDQTLAVPPQIKLPTSQVNIGDQLSAALIPSSGAGVQSGVGSGRAGGIGTGSGRGLGPGSGAGTGGGIFRVGGGVSAPVAIYKPEPEYSEEARKVKHQGVVLIAMVVGPDGRPHDMKVVRSLGMGLDEKALEAVRLWRFEPAKKDGQPVPVLVTAEVQFSLY